MLKSLKYLPPSVWILLIYSGSVVLLAWGLTHFTGLFAPLLFSSVTAYLFNPLVNRLERKTGLPRWILSAVFIFLFILIFGGVLTLVVPYFLDEMNRAALSLPKAIEYVLQRVEGLQLYLNRNFLGYFGAVDLTAQIESKIHRFFELLSDNMLMVFSSLYHLAIFAVYSVVIPLLSYYFLKDGRRVRKYTLDLIPPRFQAAALQKGHELNGALSAFIRGQLIVVVILCFVYGVGLSLLHVPFALLIAIFAGFGDIIPYLGTISGVLVSVLLTFARHQSLKQVIFVIILFVLVKLLENWLVYPRIVGKRIGVHFIWMVLILIFFSRVFGFWGLVIAFPSAAGFRIFMSDVVASYKKSDYYLRG